MGVRSEKRQERERDIILGLVDLYIELGQPIGSNALRNQRLPHLSSATLRNYLVRLEQEGYLEQKHVSGGRIPTFQAYRFYVDHYSQLKKGEQKKESQNEGRVEYGFCYSGKTHNAAIVDVLYEAADQLSVLGCGAVAAMLPKFQQDSIDEIRFFPLDAKRCLGALLTRFGTVDTVLLRTDRRWSHAACQRIEQALNARLYQHASTPLSPEEGDLAERVYQDLMTRFIMDNVPQRSLNGADVHTTGFFRLLRASQTHSALLTSGMLSLFENQEVLRKTLYEVCKEGDIKLWIGKELEELVPYLSKSTSTISEQCSLLGIPYCIHGCVVGALGLMVPMRVPYVRYMDLLHEFSRSLSSVLSHIAGAQSITWRGPVLHLSESGMQSVALPHREEKGELLTCGELHGGCREEKQREERKGEGE